jgi:hypothetical protein
MPESEAVKMKTNLLNRKGAVTRPAWNWETLREDLTLEPLLQLMSKGEETIYKSSENVLSSPLVDMDSILYRKAVLEDCIKNSKQIRNLYEITIRTVERQEQSDLIFGAAQTAEQQFDVSRRRLHLLIESLKLLKSFADDNTNLFGSEGFLRLFSDWENQLDAEFFDKADDLLDQLSFKHGVLIGVDLSGIGRSTGHRLLVNHELNSKWDPFNSFQIESEDRSAAEDLLYRQEVAESGCNSVLSKAALDIESYFKDLLQELAFYIGCLNFTESMAAREIPYCIPSITENGERNAESLYELSIAMSNQNGAVSNNLDLNGKHCIIITGADLGGKSTFLRSVGQSQLMMQCGMPVAAKSYSAPVAASICTHFLREEDRAMKNGKLNEELSRMNYIVDHLTAGSVILFDESFCSTTEREGSEIARQVMQALLEAGIDVFMVTHLYGLTKALYDGNNPAYSFLVAERLPNGQRSKRIVAGMPLPTGYGKDLYSEVFGM